MSDRLDHGIVNLPLHKRGNGSLDAQIDRNLRQIKAEQYAKWKAAKAENAERDKPVPFTREQLEAARIIRTCIGWHRVIQVNKKSVTVQTEYSWTTRYPIENILEVKS